MERDVKAPTELETEEINTIITPDQFISAIKIWKEQTSTSPSGRHLGHYKTIIKDRVIVQYYCTMCKLPLQYGFAPERWHQAVQTILSKDDEPPKLSRLRNINMLRQTTTSFSGCYGDEE